MASVQIDLGNTTQVPDDIWYSRGIPPNRAMEGLLGGISQGVQGAVQTGYEQIVRNIKGTVMGNTSTNGGIVGNTLDQFGLGQQGAIATLNHGQGAVDSNGTPYNPLTGQPTANPATSVSNPLIRGRGTVGGAGPGAGPAPVLPGSPASGAVGDMGFHNNSSPFGPQAAAPVEAPATTTVSNTGNVAAPNPATKASIDGNPILSDAYSYAQRIQNAWQQGKMNSALLWANFDAKAKELRQMFPGFNDEINQIFNDAVGYHTIAGRQISSVEEAMRQNAGGKDVSRETAILEKNGGDYIASGGDPKDVETAWGGVNGGSPNMGLLTHIATQGSVYRAKKDQLDNEHMSLENQAAAGKLNDQQISGYYNRATSMISDNVLRGTMVQAGGTKQNLQTFYNGVVNDFSSGKPISDETWTSLKGGIQQARDTAAAQIHNLDTDDLVSRLSPKDRQEQMALALEPYDAMLKAIDNKDSGMLAHYGSILHMRQDQIERASLNDPRLATAYATGKISPGAAQMYGITNSDEIVAAVGSQVSQLMGTHTATASDALKFVQQDLATKKITQAQGEQIITSAITKNIDAITSGKMSTPDTVAWAKMNLGPNDGFQQVWSTLNPQGRMNLYNALTSPKFSAAIAASGDPEVQSNYQQWMLDRAVSLPGIKQGIDTIQSRMNSSENAAFNYTYDPQNHRFNVVMAKPTGGGFGQGNGPGMRLGQETSANNTVAPVNQFLSNYAAMLKAQGKDPNDPRIGVPAVLQSLGLGSMAPQQKGEAGGEGGALGFNEKTKNTSSALASIETGAAPAGIVLNNQDRDRMIRTIYGEAGAEGPEGMRAVGHVIANRLEAGGGFGTSMTQVTRPSQFNNWAPMINGQRNGAYRNTVMLSPNSPEYQAIGEIVDNIMSGKDADNTHGASHYYNPHTANPAWGDKYAKDNDVTIGNHRFVGHVDGLAPQGLNFTGPDEPSPETSSKSNTGMAQRTLKSLSPEELDSIMEDLRQRSAPSNTGNKELDRYIDLNPSYGEADVQAKRRWDTIHSAVEAEGGYDKQQEGVGKDQKVLRSHEAGYSDPTYQALAAMAATKDGQATLKKHGINPKELLRSLPGGTNL